VPSTLILYQYFHPDDVVSSVHLTQLAEGLASRGWDVTAMPCNRSCRNPAEKYPSTSTHGRVSIKRVWRPGFSSKRSWGRLTNCAWMIAAWSMRSLIYKPDVVIIGTDPAMSAVAAIPWKLFRKKTCIVHWCFDLYPEAAVCDGMLKPGLSLSALESIMRTADKRLDLIANIGDCMRDRLSAYASPAQSTALPPWALTEPASPLAVDLSERTAIFGNARLALMYSGNFGRAHSYSELLTIARELRDSGIHIAFSIRGNRAQELRDAVSAGDRNISFVPFTSIDRLEARLSAPDIHVVSLRPEWTGTVVPSKFFGALAAGRPVLFIGSEDSFVARVIRKHALGWVCSPGCEQVVAAELRALAANPFSLRHLREHCHSTYQKYFSRTASLDRFDFELRRLVAGNLAQSADDVVPIPASVQ
jgi:colanic acid biosynthesis glycosyl transferase WcaI